MGDIELQIFADRLKLLRNNLNITQKEFAEKIGITAAALSSYENNLKNPSIAVAKRIAETFNVSIDWLCGLSEREKNDDSVETYADVIKLILKLTDNENLKTMIFTVPNENAAFWGFDNSVLHKFFVDWEKIKSIYDQKVIDIDMYQPWINAKLQELDTPIKKSSTNKLNCFVGRIFYKHENNLDTPSE